MKSILAVADGGPALEAVMLAAGHVAGLTQGRVDVMHIRDALSIHDASPAAFMIEGATEAIIQEGEHTAAERSARAMQVFERLAPGLPKPRFVEYSGEEADIVVVRGRVSDLIVVARPGSDPVKPEPAYVPAAIFESARPVMIVPPAWRPGQLRRAMIAWNGSVQAARAVGYALPLLRHVEQTIVVVPEGEESAAPADLLDYLAANDVRATATEVDMGSGSARSRGRILVQQVEALQADLLVMGGYGQQGVLRFLGLGGATGKVITACKAPVLLAR